MLVASWLIPAAARFAVLVRQDDLQRRLFAAIRIHDSYTWFAIAGGVKGDLFAVRRPVRMFARRIFIVGQRNFHREQQLEAKSAMPGVKYPLSTCKQCGLRAAARQLR